VLFITHDFGVVAEIADQVVVLELGHMIEQGDKHEVLTRPSQPYTRMLLDAVPELSLRKRQPLPEADPLLRACKVSKAYVTGSWPLSRRHVHALQEASVSVRPRETVGIVGESGSGKSTLARCIARLIEPTSGDIEANGRSVARLRGRQLSPFRRDVQVIFQDPYRSLNPRRSVGSSIIEEPIPERVLGWPAPTHLNRKGPGLRTQAPHCRRSGLGSGCVGASANPRLA
jgi:peptide/nickel transport system ATP-binding protein